MYMFCCRKTQPFLCICSYWILFRGIRFSHYSLNLIYTNILLHVSPAFPNFVFNFSAAPPASEQQELLIDEEGGDLWKPVTDWTERSGQNYPTSRHGDGAAAKELCVRLKARVSLLWEMKLPYDPLCPYVCRLVGPVCRSGWLVGLS